LMKSTCFELLNPFRVQWCCRDITTGNLLRNYPWLFIFNHFVVWIKDGTKFYWILGRFNMNNSTCNVGKTGKEKTLIRVEHE